MTTAPSTESAFMPAMPSDRGRAEMDLALSSLSRFGFEVGYDVHRRVHLGLLEDQEHGGEQDPC